MSGRPPTHTGGIVDWSTTAGIRSPIARVSLHQVIQIIPPLSSDVGTCSMQKLASRVYRMYRMSSPSRLLPGKDVHRGLTIAARKMKHPREHQHACLPGGAGVEVDVVPVCSQALLI